MSQADALIVRPHGHVIQKLVQSRKIIREGSNLCVDSAMEVMLQALFGKAAIAGIVFGTLNGSPVTPSLRTITSLATAQINQFPDTRSYASKDNLGLRTIGTFTAIYTPGQEFTYDVLGLIADSGLLVAATGFEPVTLQAQQAISVQWTLMLRG